MYQLRYSCSYQSGALIAMTVKIAQSQRPRGEYFVLLYPSVHIHYFRVLS